MYAANIPYYYYYYYYYLYTLLNPASFVKSDFQEDFHELKFTPVKNLFLNTRISLL